MVIGGTPVLLGLRYEIDINPVITPLVALALEIST